VNGRIVEASENCAWGWRHQVCQQQYWVIVYRRQCSPYRLSAGTCHWQHVWTTSSHN